MKILIFAGGFFPGKTFGGPPVSVDNFCSLMNEFDCYIVTSEHDNGTTERYKGINDGWNDRGNAKVLYLSDKEYFSLKRLNEITREIQPDWIYLQSLFQDLALLGLIVAKRNHIKVMLAPRGELCAGAFKKKYKKIPYIMGIRLLGLLGNAHFQSTSEEETEAIHRYLNADYKRIHFLTNIPSIPVNNYQRSYKKPGSGRFVFLSRIHPKKNLKMAIECFDGVEGSIRFDIYGPLEDKQYWTECQNCIKQLSNNIIVEYHGLVDHDDVHKVFSKYDAFLFPTYSENYGHVIAEALIVGCPVIISDQTPWSDVNDYNAGWAIPLSKIHDYRCVIKQIIGFDDVKMTEMSDNAKRMCEEKLEKEKIHKIYLNAFTG